MKKIVLSLAGALAATAFAPEAAAIPAFARQTGMACTACHAQHFPVLNSFGRAFKAGGYTMMGAQGKIEGDHMSIPDTLNMSMIVKLRYQDDDTNGDGLPTEASAQTIGEGQFQFFDEFALLVGGRIAENVGVFFEGQMLETGPLMGILRMPFVWDMGGAKLSVVPFAADGGSAMVGYELSSGGVLRANRWAESRDAISAVQYNRNKEVATGFAFVAQNDMGYINFTKWAPFNSFKDGGGKNSSALTSNYIRVAATPTVADWAMHIGVGRMSGSGYGLKAGTATFGEIVTDQTFFDFQAQGEVGGKELGVYFQHSKTPALSAAEIASGAISAYNKNGAVAGRPDRKATTIGVDYSIIPHVLSIGAAYRKADNGLADSAVAGAGNGDDAWTLTAVYDLYQNVALHANYVDMSGSAHGGANTQDKLTTLMLEMSW